MKTCLMLAAGLVLVSATASAEPMAGRPQSWDRLVEKVTGQGSFQPGDEASRRPPGYTLETKKPGKIGHEAEYVSVWGRQATDGSFTPGYMTMVSESWTTRIDGAKEVDQWILTLELNGSIIRGQHQVLVLRDGILLDSRTFETNEAAHAAHRDGRLQYWLERP